MDQLNYAYDEKTGSLTVEAKFSAGTSGVIIELLKRVPAFKGKVKIFLTEMDEGFREELKEENPALLERFKKIGDYFVAEFEKSELDERTLDFIIGEVYTGDVEAYLTPDVKTPKKSPRIILGHEAHDYFSAEKLGLREPKIRIILESIAKTYSAQIGELEV